MNKNLINFQKINNRYEEIKGLLVNTPLLQSDEINSLFSSNIFFKAENLQKTGSFKFRGACSAISSLSMEQIKSGVVCFSSGNHAQGIALAAKLHKTTAKIIMPKDAPKIKIQNTKKYGAKIVFYDRGIDDRESIGEQIAHDENRVLIKPFDNYDVILGQGTAALQAINNLQEKEKNSQQKFDAAIICTSGGGLAAGSGTVLKFHNSDCSLYTAEPHNWNDHEKSFELKERFTINSQKHGICDALENPIPGEITFPINVKNGFRGLSASENSVRIAMQMIMRNFNFIVEPSGAIGLACLLENENLVKDKNVLIILSGGNIDRTSYNNIISGR